MQNIFWKTTLALSAVALIGKVNAEEPTVDEGVLVLTDSNFDEAIKKHSDGILVEFYAPWCGHCQQLAPEYAKAAEILGKKSPPRYLAKVDATEQEATSKRFNVEGFPTLKWFVDSEAQEYSGGRTSDTIVSWIMKKTGPPSEALSCGDLDATVAGNKLNVVLFGEQTTEMGKAFIDAAKKNEKATFYHTTADCAAAHGASADGVALFRTFDEPKVVYTGPADSRDMEVFFRENSVESLFAFSDDSVEPIFHNSQPAMIYFQDGEPPAAYAQASKDLKGKILFSYSGVTDGIQEQLAEFVGVTAEDMPCIRIIVPSETGVNKYRYEGDMSAATAESIAEFVNNWSAGSLQPFRKSEDAPADNNGPVRIIVGNTFEDEVMKSDNDVLVKYYAPWCGHCTALAPHWDALGEAVKGINGLVIAKYDATKNENEGVEVESFPTLKLYTKEDKTGMDVQFNHEEGKQTASLQNFLRKNSSAYKAARPDEPIEADDFPAQEEEHEGEDMGEMPEYEGDDNELEMTEEEMAKFQAEMDAMTDEEREQMERDMNELAGDDEIKAEL